MKFQDFAKGDVKIHIGCEKDYLEDWINVNSNPENTNIECDATWNLSTIAFWKKDSADVIFAENFLEDIERNSESVEVMLASYKHMLKPKGKLLIGLSNPAYVNKIAPWLKGLGFINVECFDSSSSDFEHIPV